VGVVLQRLAVEGDLGVIKGGIASMDRHVVPRAQKHHVLNPILAAAANLVCNPCPHDLARL
jgi:hypothetical protein